MAFGSFKPKAAFHMPSINKEIAAKTRRKPIMGTRLGMPKMQLGMKGLGTPKIKL